MAKSDFVPKSDNDFLVWHDRFKTNVLANAGTFGLVAADTTPITTDNADIHTKVTNVNNTSAIARMAVADKNTSRTNTEAHARALARRIKAHPAYTVALGNLLGIEGPESTTSLATSHPELTGTDKAAGLVEVQFSKLTSDGVNIYCKRDGDADFAFLARDTASPYVDNRPLKVPGKPELREYKARFVQDDQEIGLFSNELVVNCAP